jgi:hypothetical protein
LGAENVKAPSGSKPGGAPSWRKHHEDRRFAWVMFLAQKSYARCIAPFWSLGDVCGMLMCGVL